MSRTPGGWQTRGMPSSQATRASPSPARFGGVGDRGRRRARFDHRGAGDRVVPRAGPAPLGPAGHGVRPGLVDPRRPARPSAPGCSGAPGRPRRLDVPALTSYSVQLGLSLAWMLLFFGATPTRPRPARDLRAVARDRDDDRGVRQAPPAGGRVAAAVPCLDDATSPCSTPHLAAQPQLALARGRPAHRRLASDGIRARHCSTRAAVISAAQRRRPRPARRARHRSGP